MKPQEEKIKITEEENDGATYVVDKDDVKDVKNDIDLEDGDKVVVTSEVANGDAVVEYIEDFKGEAPFVIDDITWKYVWARYPDGKRDIAAYRADHDVAYSIHWFKDEVLKPIFDRVSNEGIKESKTITKGAINEMISTALLDRLDNGSHSLKSNPSLPTINDEDYISTLVSSSYDNVVKKLKASYGVDDVDLTSMLGDYGESLVQIRDTEANLKEELKVLAKDIILDEFFLDESDIEFDLDIIEDITEFDNQKFKPEIKFQNSDEIELVNSEIHKRRLINTIIQGGSRRVGDLVDKYKNKVIDVEPKLAKLYNDVLLFSDLMYYANNEPDLKSIKSGALSIVMDGTKPKIIARGVNFPALLMEVGKGVFEILTHDGLPTDPRVMEYVVSKADKDQYESDDVRLGISIYDKLVDVATDSDKRVKYLLVNKLSKVVVPEFHAVMRNILADTKDGDDYMNQLLKGVKEELGEYDSLKDEYNNSFFTPDEFDDYELGL